jgi:hypothetical protein
MKANRVVGLIVCVGLLGIAAAGLAAGASSVPDDFDHFPRSLDGYNDGHIKGIFETLKFRISAEPFNLFATLIFLCAIIHTFLTSKFMAVSHQLEEAHRQKIQSGRADKHSVSIGAGLMHFLGEVEAVFGIWVIALVAVIYIFHDWKTVVNYISYRVNFNEAAFVVVIMTLAATRPILKLAEAIMAKLAALLGGGSLAAWWLTILTIGPILGSFITEPAAMTISALLLARRFYELEPSNRFKYATIGLLFVNISVGGTLSNFAAPPVLMVAGPWKWDIGYMLVHFGWKAVFGILASNGIYFLAFRRELTELNRKYAVLRLKNDIQQRYMQRHELEEEFEQMNTHVGETLGFSDTCDLKCLEVKERIRKRLDDRHLDRVRREGLDKQLVDEAFEQRFEEIKQRVMRRSLPGLLPEKERPNVNDPDWDEREDPVPAWVTVMHVLFMAWTVVNEHYPHLFVPGLLFFLGFAQVTGPYQNRIDLKPPLLVGFFIGGLVIHGGVQGWWLQPVLGSLAEIPLMVGATILTAFNDNAAITFLSTLVPGFTDELKYAVLAGAVTGGGLTVIANAPNPAGQSILKKYFDNGVSPLGLLKGAILPTCVLFLCFLLLRNI